MRRKGGLADDLIDGLELLYCVQSQAMDMQDGISIVHQCLLNSFFPCEGEPMSGDQKLRLHLDHSVLACGPFEDGSRGGAPNRVEVRKAGIIVVGRANDLILRDLYDD